MSNLGKILEACETLWPASNAEDWDNPGLVCGNVNQNVNKIMFTVDVTSDVVTEAIANGVDLLIAHHPYLLRGVMSLSESTSKGAVVSDAIRANLAIFGAHTNADVVEFGVSDVLAKNLGLNNLVPLQVTGENIGIGRVGYLEDALTLGHFAKNIAKALPATASGIRVAGDFNQIVEKVAVCGGAGDSLLALLSGSDVDAYVTADLRHHVAQDFREQALLNGGKPALIDVSHWASEWLWLESAAQSLAAQFPNIEILVSDIRTDPWDFAITQ